MRILSLLLVACVHNPDPRMPSVESVQQGGLGAWIVVEASYHIEGELIAVEPAIVRVLTPDRHLLSIGKGEIVSAKLFEYESEGGIGAWGTVGSVSTISHGFFSVFSLPVWIITASVTAWAESHSVLIEYPKHDWNEMTAWARFPQGLPVGLDEAALLSHAYLVPAVPHQDPPGPYPADPNDHPGPAPTNR